MTPREADVAFVLEPLDGVKAAYAIERGRQAAHHFDFAVELEPGTRHLAEAHYALLRALSYDDCARVFFFVDSPPTILGYALRELRLDQHHRDAARARVGEPLSRAPIVQPTPAGKTIALLLVGVDEPTARVAREVLEGIGRTVVTRALDEAVNAATTESFDMIVCDASRAFGSNALLARLPLELSRRIFVLAGPSELADARWRLQGMDRILFKPLEAWFLRERLGRVGALHILREPAMARLVAERKPPRKLATPALSSLFEVLLVDLHEPTTDVLDSILRDEASVARQKRTCESDPDRAVELALSSTFHLRICSSRAALGERRFLDALAREDPAGADTVLVAAAADEVIDVQHRLAQQGRSNTVLPLPLEEALLRREVLRRHPGLSARAATAETAVMGPTAGVTAPRYRRLAVLVVDDDTATRILFSAGTSELAADLTLTTTPMEAFEHVTSRPVDILFVSSSMRGDGGESLYRVLWRLSPELKARSILITPADIAPASTRVLERPVTREALARVIAALSAGQG